MNAKLTRSDRRDQKKLSRVSTVVLRINRSKIKPLWRFSVNFSTIGAALPDSRSKIKIRPDTYVHMSFESIKSYVSEIQKITPLQPKIRSLFN